MSVSGSGINLSFRNPLPSPSNHFRFDFSNIRGLKSNLLSVYLHLQFEQPQFLGLTEVQVVGNDDVEQYHIAGYSFLSAFFPHRGIAAYVRDDVSFRRLSEAEFCFMWVRLKSESRETFLCLLYRSPNLSDDRTLEKFEELSNIIEEIYSSSPDAEIVLAGDFNVHNIPWLAHSARTDPAGRCVELFAELNLLTQLVGEPTRIPDNPNHNRYLLDLFLTSNPERYTSVSVKSPLGGSDHCLISASFPSRSGAQSPSPMPRRKHWHYGRADWSGLNSFFKSIHWHRFFYEGDLNQATALITAVLLRGMELFIPSSMVKRKMATKSWFNNECRVAIRQRNAAYRNLGTNPSRLVIDEFVVLRNNCKRVITNAKNQHDLKMKQRLLRTRQGSKAFWSFVKAVSNNFVKSSTPPLHGPDGNPVIDSKAKANLLAALFAKNSTIDESNMAPPTLPSANSAMKTVYFRRRVVLRVLQALDVNKSAGPDGIPPIVLRNCALSLATPLSKLFHSLFSTGQFPDLWRTANVQPVPKKGDRSDPTNYRPIALTSILSKVMERIVNSRLVAYLEDHKLINDRQYGFRCKRSTGDLMAYLTETWSRSIHNFGESLSVALDISKAFDRVWHKALLSKMRSFGICQELLEWTESFLTDRSIRVVLDGTMSDEYHLNAGVPQGSVLSPTLFLIFINDLLTLTNNEVHSFADDSTLSHSYYFNKRPSSAAVSSRRSEMVGSLNGDLVMIDKWGVDNRVTFNARKTQTCLLSHRNHQDPIDLTMSGSVLTGSSNMDILGVSMNSKVLWGDHIVGVARDASRRLGFLRRCKKYFSPQNLVVIYKAYIRPRLEYNSHLWAGAPSSYLMLIDRIQRRAIRLIGDSRITNKLDSLEHRRNVGALTLFYRYFHGRCSAEISSLMPPIRVQARATRQATNSHQFTVDNSFCRTVKFRSTFISRSSILWNQLPASVFPASYNPAKFKSTIHKFLIQNPSNP